jgi:hypothetical protein
VITEFIIPAVVYSEEGECGTYDTQQVVFGRESCRACVEEGFLAAVLAAVANALVLVIASSLFGAVVVPPGETLTLEPVIAASAIGAVGAVIALGAIGRFSRRPIRVFRVTALVVLLLSLVPIPLQGVEGPSAGALALMHVLAAAIVVGVLTTTRSGR